MSTCFASIQYVMLLNIDSDWILSLLHSSLGKRHWLGFTWHRSVDIGMHLPYSHGVKVFWEMPLFYYDKLLHVLTLVLKLLLLKLFPLFSQNQNHHNVRIFSLSSSQIIAIFIFQELQNTFGFFISWIIFTIGIKQWCIDGHSKSPTMVYNPVILVSIKGVLWNGQTLENGLKLNNLKWEWDS